MGGGGGGGKGGEGMGTEGGGRVSTQGHALCSTPPCTWVSAQRHPTAARLQGCPQQPLWPALLACFWRQQAAVQGLVPGTALPLPLPLLPGPCLMRPLPGSALIQPACHHPTASDSVIGARVGQEKMQRGCRGGCRANTEGIDPEGLQRGF